MCCSGGAGDKGQDDGVRHHHGELPAPGGQGELLQDGHLQPRCHFRGHRLPYRGDRTTRPGPIKPPSSSSPPPLPHTHLWTDEICCDMYW